MIYLVSLLGYILDNTFNYYLNLETMFFISTILIYMILYNKKKKRIYIILIISLIYDLFIEKVYFINGIIFYILYLIISYSKKLVKQSKVMDMLLLFICLIVYIIIKSFILWWTGYNYFVNYIFNKILITLIINTIYDFIVYLILGIKVKKA